MNEFYDRYQKSLYIVENGLGAKDVVNEDRNIDDLYRIEYLREHIKAVMTFDRAVIDEAGHPDTVILIVTNTDEYSKIQLEKTGKTEGLEKLLSVI